MGRATVISGGTDGRYVIEMDYGSAQRDAMIAKIDLDLYQLGLRKTWQQEQLDDVAIGLVSLQNEQTALINAYVAASKLIPPNKELTESIRKQLDAKTAEVIRQQLIVNNARVALGMTNAQIKSAQLERAKLEQAEIVEQRAAWCADLTETATGTVATLEVPGESALILIRPQAPAPSASDGLLTAREVQTPAQVFWNAAVLPGWQKFKPTYRWGTITELNTVTDRCTVALAQALSSAQALNVNQAATLANVPIVYMTCNAAAFDVGDRVVVQFVDQDWAQPKVIGFVDHPRACGGHMLGVAASESYYDSYNGLTGVWKNYRSTAMPDELVAGLDIGGHPGHITWSSRLFAVGTREVQLSWKGADSRYSEALGWADYNGGTIIPYEQKYLWGNRWCIGDADVLYKATSYVWIDGRRVDTGIIKVLAAAFHEPTPGSGHVVLRVCSDNWPQDGTTRGMVVFDLVCPSATPGGCTLAELIAATSLSIESTYPALDFSYYKHPAAGKWRHLQHPHFNSLGTMLATTITEVKDPPDGSDEQRGVTGATFAIPGWTLTRVPLPSSESGTRTVTNGVGPDGYHDGNSTWTENKTEFLTAIIAIDFLRTATVDELVYVSIETTTLTQTDGAQTYDDGEFSVSDGGSAGFTRVVRHSKYGTLREMTQDYTWAFSGGNTGYGTPVNILNTFADERKLLTAFTGDLSRDAYGIGYCASVLQPAHSISGPSASINGDTYFTAAVGVTENNGQIIYDLFLAGQKVVSQLASGYAFDYPTSGRTVQENAQLTFTNLGQGPDPIKVTVTNWTSQHGVSAWESGSMVPSAKYGHMAAAPERTVAYFGVHHYHGSTNLVIRNAPAGLPSVQEVPAYAPGDSPTLAAPVFLGTPKHYP